MHRSRLCAILIDCKATAIEEAAGFWSKGDPLQGLSILTLAKGFHPHRLRNIGKRH